MSRVADLEKAANAEDLFNLLEHISWVKVVKPELLKRKATYEKALVDHLLGAELPGNLTKEQLAGRVYGINEIISLFEKILTQGQKALENLSSEGINLQ